MGKVLVFVSNEMADFEVTLALQILRNVGNREIITAGYAREPVVSQAGFTSLPNCTLTEALAFDGVEAMIIPGGPIRPQGEDLTRLIRQTEAAGKLLAAVCFGPQYLGRAGVLDQRRFTTSCSPATIQSLGVADPYPRHNYVEARCVQDGAVITAKGSAFVDFAFAIADALGVYADRPQERQRFYNDVTGRAV